jgi:hypothetical protein
MLSKISAARYLAYLALVAVGSCSTALAETCDAMFNREGIKTESLCQEGSAHELCGVSSYVSFQNEAPEKCRQIYPEALNYSVPVRLCGDRLFGAAGEGIYDKSYRLWEGRGSKDGFTSCKKHPDDIYVSTEGSVGEYSFQEFRWKYTWKKQYVYKVVRPNF